MPPMLVVHVGDQDTFDRELQSALAEGTVRIGGKKLCYPLVGRDNHHSHLQFFNAVYSPNLIYEDLLYHLREEFQKSDADFFIISSAFLTSLRPEALKEVLDIAFPEVPRKIVKVIRSHADYAISRFQKKLTQMRTTSTIEDIVPFCQSYPPFYTQAENASLWCDIFEGEVVLLPFEHASPEDFITDFLVKTTGTSDDHIHFAIRPEALQRPMPIDEIRLYELAVAAIPDEIFVKDDNAQSDFSVMAKERDTRPALHETELDRMMRHLAPAFLKNYSQGSEDFVLNRSEIADLSEFCAEDARQLDELCDTSFFSDCLTPEKFPEITRRDASFPAEAAEMFSATVTASQTYLSEHLKNALP